MEEAQLLKEQGGAGTVNPETGLLEFGRFSGSMSDRRDKQRYKAANRQASAARAARGNQRSGDWDAGKNRTLGYNDFNPGGAYGGNNLNGTKRTGDKLARHKRTVAKHEAEKKAEQDRKLDRRRSYLSAPQDGDIETGC